MQNKYFWAIWGISAVLFMLDLFTALNFMKYTSSTEANPLFADGVPIFIIVVINLFFLIMLPVLYHKIKKIDRFYILFAMTMLAVIRLSAIQLNVNVSQQLSTVSDEQIKEIEMYYETPQGVQERKESYYEFIWTVYLYPILAGSVAYFLHKLENLGDYN